MKNWEKYREELIDLIKLEHGEGDGVRSALCDFVKIKVLPNYTIKNCRTLRCSTCNKIFSFWLEEEYEEPPKPEVDWSKVPVDTLVRVRDHESEAWRLQYFKGIDDSSTDRFMVWECGATSVTAEGDYTRWKYCELVEDEEDEEFR